jgi:hypothetical protein
MVRSERHLTSHDLLMVSGLNASFRLILSGQIGVKEIERLIQKLQLDKEILVDPGNENEEASN